MTTCYDDYVAVDNISLNIVEGKVTALVGPNGCGKSTLLKSIARVLKPKKGIVLLNGKNIQTIPTKDVAKQMALLPQSPITPDDLTVRELVRQGRFPYQNIFGKWSAEDDAAVHQAMEDTDTLQFSEQLVTSLSGGQRQRCWLAMVLAQEADVILLDEPTTFLDLKVQIDVMSALSQISQTRGKTMLIVMHELNVAAAFVDQMVMMRNATIVCQGSPNEMMKADIIRSVFDLEASVVFDPSSGRPVCVPKVGER